jgi:hypothetical protein
VGERGYNARVTCPGQRLRVLVALCGLAGCGAPPRGATGVELDLTTDDPDLHPWSYQVLWFDQVQQLLTLQVPDSGRLSDDPKAAASVFIELDPRTLGERRVVARGLRESGLVSLGALRLTPMAARWMKVPLATSSPQKLPDSDGDGLPDLVDNCPLERDPCPPPDAPDAAADASPDAMADAMAERPPGSADGRE